VKDAADVFDDLMQENFASISCAVLPDQGLDRCSAAHLGTRLSGTWVDFR
jgi:hypothetical protein